MITSFLLQDIFFKLDKQCKHKNNQYLVINRQDAKNNYTLEASDVQKDYGKIDENYFETENVENT